ncbi:MAG: hypothetical protein ABI700_04360 [Chloroflexota bacterium]
MLRFWITVSLLLTIIFTGIGLLLSRQWGWSEYASDELYVVYSALVDSDKLYFIVNANGSSKSETLKSTQGTITAVNCSPDGRTLAFLTDAMHLYVVTSTGLIYDKLINRIYANLTVANNGTVVYFQNTDAFRVDANHAEQLVLPGGDYPRGSTSYYDYVGVSSQRFELWSSPPDGVQVVSPTGQILSTIFHANVEQLWTSERIFTYFFYPTTFSGDALNSGRYLFDTSTEHAFRLSELTPFSLFSPDGTLEATAGVVDGQQVHDQIVVVDPFKPIGSGRQLTHDLDTTFALVCFLTFRPQMLLADNP